jgi:hypothetical protein
MTWEAFEQQYSTAGAVTSEKALQVMHAGGTHGHQLNRGDQTPAGYAAGFSEAQPEQAAPAPAAPVAAPPQVTIAPNAEPIASVKVIPTSGPNGVPTDQRWQAAVTEVLGAATATHLAGVPTLASERGWSVAISADGPAGFVAPGVGIGPGGTIFRYGGQPTAQPASQSEQNLMMVTVSESGPENFGQWTRAQAFSTADNTSGAVLVDESGLPLGLAMRLAPGAGLVAAIPTIADAVSAAFTPPPANAPGALPAQSGAPTQTPPDATAVTSALAAALQQMAAGQTPAMAPNSAGSVTATPSPTQNLQPHAPAPVPGATPTAPPVVSSDLAPGTDGDFPPAGVSIHRSEVERNGVQYALFLMDGAVHPTMIQQADVPMLPGEQVVLSDWPYLDGPSGKTKGGVVIDWSYGGGAVGNVRTAPSAPAALDGWSLAVNTDVGPGPSDNDTEAKLIVTVRTNFTKDGEPPRTGVSTVTLCGHGKHDMQHKDESPATVDAPVMA